MNASTTRERSIASVFTTTARTTPAGGAGTASAIVSIAPPQIAAATWRARAKRVMFSSCTASMLQPQMLSCGWFCSSSFHACRSSPDG